MTVQIFPTIITHPSIQSLALICTAGINISIVFLGSSDQDYQAVKISIHGGIIFYNKSIRSPFDDFVYIRIVKRVISFLFSFDQVASKSKIIQPAGFFTFLKCQWYGNISVGFDSLTPDSVLKCHICKRYTFNGFLWFGL